MESAFAVCDGDEESFANEPDLVVFAKSESFAPAISGQFQVASRQARANRYPPAVAPGGPTRAPIK